jgi:hypothetical protein
LKAHRFFLFQLSDVFFYVFMWVCGSRRQFRKELSETEVGKYRYLEARRRQCTVVEKEI